MRAGRGRFRVLMLYVVLEMGALAGVPMRPDDIERLMQMLSRPKLVQALPDEAKKDGEGPGPP